MQNDIQQGAVDLQVTIVVDETQFAEFSHEETRGSQAPIGLTPSCRTALSSLPITITSGTKIYPMRLRNTLNWRIS